MVCCDASLSRAEGSRQSSRAWMCDHRPWTAPSRIPIQSLMPTHSHRKTCPVIATRSTRKPSPETWSDSRVAFPVKRQIQHSMNGQRHKKQNWFTSSHIHVFACIYWCIIILLLCKPWTAAIRWSTSGTAVAVFNKSLSLFHRNSSPETRSPQSHKPTKRHIRKNVQHGG